MEIGIIYLFTFLCYLFDHKVARFLCKVYGLIYNANGIKFYFVFLAPVLYALPRKLPSFLDARVMNTY